MLILAEWSVDLISCDVFSEVKLTEISLIPNHGHLFDHLLLL